MRFVLCLLFASLTAAAQQPAAPAVPAAPTPPWATQDNPRFQSFILPAPGQPPPDTAQQNRRFRIFPGPWQRSVRAPIPESNLCYKLRVYQMARRPQSDETRPLGERTCTPAARFRLKPPVLQEGEDDSGCVSER